jgi:hypothetical protein
MPEGVLVNDANCLTDANINENVFKFQIYFVDRVKKVTIRIGFRIF